jgi:hypothetical protein
MELSNFRPPEVTALNLYYFKAADIIIRLDLKEIQIEQRIVRGVSIRFPEKIAYFEGETANEKG